MNKLPSRKFTFPSYSTPKVLLQNTRKTIMSQLLGERKAKRVFDAWGNLNIDQFLVQYKIHSGVKHYISQNHIDRIPTEGSLIVLANHPTGIPDGLLILDTVLKKRRDVKLIVDVDTYPNIVLKDYTISIHSGPNQVNLNATSLKEALDWLEDGHCLVLFSNNEVDTNRQLFKRFSDNFWHPTVKKIILKNKGQVLPWAISGKNSILFYRLSQINPELKNALLARESLKRNRRPIYSVIGKAFRASDEHSINDLELKIRLMSRKTNSIDFKRFIPQLTQTEFEPIADEIDAPKIKLEIQNLGEPIITKGANQIFLTSQAESPNTLLEIGRLRELTFRNVNEGSGKCRDLDSYDRDFKHLILWDSEGEKLVGAYRLGIGPELHKDSNYHNILYDFYERNLRVEELLSESMVMGRAFVAPAYQQKAFPLFMLWQGITWVVQKHPEIKYLIGQTSLPNTFHDYSKLLITGFLWKHFSNPDKAKYFKAYHPLKLKHNALIEDWIANSHPDDIKRMDKIIECIEPNGAKTPMLFKRYVDQKAYCVGINIDPDFQNSIDILMMTNVADIAVTENL